MSIKFTVLLYSKYSDFSTNLISQINAYQSVFVENFNIKLLCIDNEAVRKRIMNSKKISITSVPTILVIYEDGGVEKYENNDAFVWVNEVLQRISSLETQNTIQQEDINENIDGENNIVYQPKPQPKSQSKSQPKSRPKAQLTPRSNAQPKSQPFQNSRKKNIPDNKTSIEDLEELDVEFGMDQEDEYNEENFEFPQDSMTQIESTNALTTKKNDLLSLAAEMQKNRDSFEKKTDKPRM
jgi:hypothetical protein